jgi:hypothetical protein
MLTAVIGIALIIAVMVCTRFIPAERDVPPGSSMGE